MEQIVQEIFVTVSVALLLSFLVGKLISMAMGCDGEVDLKSAAAMEEMKFGERLCAGGSESVTRVYESVEDETNKVNEFEGEKSLAEVVVVDQRTEISLADKMIVKECSELQENLVTEVESEVVELTDNLSAENSIEEVVVAAMERVGEMIVEESCELKENLVKEEGKREEESEVVESPENLSEVKVDEIGLESKIEDEQSEEIRVEGLIDGDEDDWEGIERSELEKDFAAAASFVGGGENDGRLASVVGNDVQMQLYGLHKIATQGRCDDPQPMALKMSARAKWNAWLRQGNMSPQVAMEQYIALLSDRVPGWMEDNAIGESEKDILKADIPIALDPDSDTFRNKREPDPKLGSEGVDATGSSNSANRDNE